MVQSHGTPSQYQPPKLLEQVREAIRARHYSLRTEETYLRWIKRFILFHGKRHPREMGGRRSRSSYHIWPWKVVSLPPPRARH